MGTCRPDPSSTQKVAWSSARGTIWVPSTAPAWTRTLQPRLLTTGRINRRHCHQRTPRPAGCQPRALEPAPASRALRPPARRPLERRRSPPAKWGNRRMSPKATHPQRSARQRRHSHIRWRSISGAAQQCVGTTRLLSIVPARPGGGHRSVEQDAKHKADDHDRGPESRAEPQSVQVMSAHPPCRNSNGHTRDGPAAEPSRKAVILIRRQEPQRMGGVRTLSGQERAVKGS